MIVKTCMFHGRIVHRMTFYGFALGFTGETANSVLPESEEAGANTA
jgi:hypothetical protein